MNILVLGSGGREHAIAWALSKSPRCDELFVAPGNGGTAAVATNVNDVDMMSGSSVLSFVREHGVDLVVVGPEAPLVAGVADELRDAGISVFGPDAAGALLEGSKAHSRRSWRRTTSPTAAYATFDSCDPAIAYIREQGASRSSVEGRTAWRPARASSSLSTGRRSPRTPFASASTASSAMLARPSLSRSA